MKWEMARKEGQQLYQIALDLKPSVIVEVGTFKGHSGAWFLKALEELGKGLLITIDITKPINYNKLTKAQLTANHHEATENLKAVSERFVQVVDEVNPDVPDVIDLLFIDGNHTQEACYQDLSQFYPKLRKGGICLVHDFHGIRVPAAVASYFGTEMPRHELKTDDEFKGDLLIIYKD